MEYDNATRTAHQQYQQEVDGEAAFFIHNRASATNISNNEGRVNETSPCLNLVRQTTSDEHRRFSPVIGRGTATPGVYWTEENRTEDSTAAPRVPSQGNVEGLEIKPNRKLGSDTVQTILNSAKDRVGGSQTLGAIALLLLAASKTSPRPGSGETGHNDSEGVSPNGWIAAGLSAETSKSCNTSTPSRDSCVRADNTNCSGFPCRKFPAKNDCAPIPWSSGVSRSDTNRGEDSGRLSFATAGQDSKFGGWDSGSWTGRGGGNSTMNDRGSFGTGESVVHSRGCNDSSGGGRSDSPLRRNTKPKLDSPFPVFSAKPSALWEEVERRSSGFIMMPTCGPSSINAPFRTGKATTTSTTTTQESRSGSDLNTNLSAKRQQSIHAKATSPTWGGAFSGGGERIVRQVLPFSGKRKSRPIFPAASSRGGKPSFTRTAGRTQSSPRGSQSQSPPLVTGQKQGEGYRWGNQHMGGAVRDFGGRLWEGREQTRSVGETKKLWSKPFGYRGNRRGLVNIAPVPKTDCGPNDNRIELLHSEGCVGGGDHSSASRVITRAPSFDNSAAPVTPAAPSAPPAPPAPPAPATPASPADPSSRSENIQEIIWLGGQQQLQSQFTENKYDHVGVRDFFLNGGGGSGGSGSGGSGGDFFLKQEGQGKMDVDEGGGAELRASDNDGDGNEAKALFFSGSGGGGGDGATAASVVDSVNSGGSTLSPKHRRLRGQKISAESEGTESLKLRRACDYCTDKKAGCTGGQPCLLCSRKGMECIFSVSQKQRLPRDDSLAFPGSRRPLSMDLNEDASDSSSDYPGKACTAANTGRPSPRKKSKNLVWSQFRKACDRCTDKKVRCDGSNPTGGFKACTPCKRAGESCLFGICRRSGPRDAYGHKTAVAGIIMKRNDFEKVTERLGRCRTKVCRFVNENGSFWREHFHCRIGDCCFAGKNMSELLLHRADNHLEGPEIKDPSARETEGAILTSDVIKDASVLSSSSGVC